MHFLLNYMNLKKLSEQMYISVNDINEFLRNMPSKDLDDEGLSQTGKFLMSSPTILEAVCTYPKSNLYAFDNTSYYFDVKGRLTNNLKAGQVKRINRITKLTDIYVKKHKTLSKRLHERKEEDEVFFDDVKKYFSNLNISDGRIFRSLLDGVGLVFQCPAITPGNVINAFKSRWYNVKQFHGNYKWGFKSVDELKEDGRKGMFMEGAIHLIGYLNNN